MDTSANHMVIVGGPEVEDEPLAIVLDDGKTIPLFDSVEEAETFLASTGDFGKDWRAREDCCCLLFVQDLAARETTGDVVGLSLRAHRGTVSCQIPRRCNQHVRAGNRSAQRGVLRKR